MKQIRDDVFARMDELTPAEKKVARSLLADYPSAGLASAATLAKVAGTSTPTVLRLLARLGIGSYPQFQGRRGSEGSVSMNSPVSRGAHSLRPEEEGSFFSRAISQRVELVERLRTT